MSIIGKLGINETAIFQFFIFAVTIFLLTKLVFESYFQTLVAREKKTRGVGVLAIEYQQKAIELHAEYQIKTRSVSSELKTIFDKEKAQAVEEYEKIVGGARAENSKYLAENRSQIARAFNHAMVELKGQSAQVALTISAKLLGK